MEWYLPVIWAGVIGTAVAMYVILDGFDLGLGILFPFAANDRQRDQMMASVEAVLGRQRDLAGAGRRRIVGGLPARLRGHHAGVLHSGHRDAAGAGVPRRRLRIPRRLAGGKAKWNFAFTGGSHACRALPRRGPRRHDSGHQGRELGSSPAVPFDWATPFAAVCALGVAVAMRCLARPG